MLPSVSVDESSEEEWVLEGLLVPLALLIEDEDFSSCGIAEAQVGIEHVDVPHERCIDLSSINLLEILDVDIESLHRTEHRGLVEHNLLRVRQELCMPAEVTYDAYFTGHLDSGESDGQRANPRSSGQVEKESNSEIVSHLPHDDIFGDGRLIEVDAVFMGHHSVEASVIISISVAGTYERGRLPDQRVLQSITISHDET